MKHGPDHSYTEDLTLSTAAGPTSSYVGAIVVSTDGTSLGMVRNARSTGQTIAIDLVPNPALGLRAQDVKLSLVPSGRPSDRITVHLTARQFIHFATR